MTASLRADGDRVARSTAVRSSPAAHTLRSIRCALRWFGLLSLPFTLACCLSYIGALRNSANLSLTEQSVEWLRGHHYGDVVSWVEHYYYSHNQPPEGGTLAGGLPHPVSNAPASAAATPDSITPFAAQPLPNEGVWQPYGDGGAGSTAMQVTYLRPDSLHGTVLAAVVRIDQAQAAFTLVPGSSEPGRGPWPSGNSVPGADLPQLLAAFNSGFRMADSRGGFFENGRTAVALRQGAASLVIDTAGKADIVAWGRDLSAADHPVAVRQNLDLIVDGGQLVSGLDDNTNNRWGHTVGNTLLVWRSGIGIDARGRILYVASDGLSVRTLATLLQRAGAVRAMELDINHAWVSFNMFHHTADGQLVGTKLMRGMSKPASRYLGPDSRDFIAVLARQPLPQL